MLFNYRLWVGIICVIMVLSILTTLPVFANTDISLFDIKSNSKHYSVVTFSKNDLLQELNLNAEQIQRIKATDKQKLLLFEYDIKSDTLHDTMIYCENKVKKLKKKWKAVRSNSNSQTFESYWRKELKSCHAKYIQISPDITFLFNNLNKKKYILKELSVFIYGYEKSQSVDEEYFSNKISGRELVILNDIKLHRENTITLGKYYKIEESSFSLTLKMLDQLRWAGNFERNRYIIDITFKLVRPDNNTIHEIVTQPFIVDL